MKDQKCILFKNGSSLSFHAIHSSPAKIGLAADRMHLGGFS